VWPIPNDCLEALPVKTRPPCAQYGRDAAAYSFVDSVRGRRSLGRIMSADEDGGLLSDPSLIVY
jgi:hypothetical protein